MDNRISFQSGDSIALNVAKVVNDLITYFKKEKKQAGKKDGYPGDPGREMKGGIIIHRRKRITKYGDQET